MEPRGDIVRASGVPQFSKMMKKITESLNTVSSCITKMDECNKALPSLIKAAIDEKAAELGQVIAHFVMEKFEAHSNAVSLVLADEIKRKISAVLCDLNITTKQPWAAGDEGEIHTTTDIETAGIKFGRYNEYRYRESVRKGRLFNWAVPDDFDFPAAKLQSAWFAYLLGYENNRSIARDEDTGEPVLDELGKYMMVRTPIRPLRHLSDDLLPRRNQKSTRLKRSSEMIGAPSWK